MNRQFDYLIDEAGQRRKLLEAASPAWQLKGLDGAPHSLEDLRGKVVVLDFWYRGCGPCIQCMPQVKRLAARYANAPVAIFGVNTDEDASDTAFVAKIMTLNYPTLRDDQDELLRAYGDFGFPTLVVIDQSGAIQQIQTGVSDDLERHTSKKIYELLGNN